MPVLGLNRMPTVRGHPMSDGTDPVFSVGAHHVPTILGHPVSHRADSVWLHSTHHVSAILSACLSPTISPDPLPIRRDLRRTRSDRGTESVCCRRRGGVGLG